MSISLSISDIERLAKAGVGITIGDGPGQVWPQGDPDPQPSLNQRLGPSNNMSDAIWDRWLRTKRAAQPPSQYDHGPMAFMQPFELLATRHGDTVHVSVHPTNFAYDPFILEDVALIFPSDALMAKLALWEKEHPTA